MDAGQRVFRAELFHTENGTPHWYVVEGMATGIVREGRDLIAVGSPRFDPGGEGRRYEEAAGNWHPTRGAALMDALKRMAKKQEEFLVAQQLRYETAAKRLADSIAQADVDDAGKVVIA
jgi:hypothetical protein